MTRRVNGMMRSRRTKKWKELKPSRKIQSRMFHLPKSKTRGQSHQRRRVRLPPGHRSRRIPKARLLLQNHLQKHHLQNPRRNQKSQKKKLKLILVLSQARQALLSSILNQSGFARGHLRKGVETKRIGSRGIRNRVRSPKP